MRHTLRLSRISAAIITCGRERGNGRIDFCDPFTSVAAPAAVAGTTGSARMSEKARIGFVGIGNMGWPMAANVARAGFPITVFDADRARAPRFAAEFGAKAAPSLAEL